MRLISGAVAGILVGAMLVSVVASGIVYAGAASSAELKDKLSSLEDQKAEIKKELDSTASKVSDVERPVPRSRRRSPSPRRRSRP